MFRFIQFYLARSQNEILGGAMALCWERSTKKRSSPNEELILPPNFSEDQNKVFTELKADFTRKWQTQYILLRQSDV